MRACYSLLLMLALGGLLVGCGRPQEETPPPGVGTTLPVLEIDTGDVVPADEIEIMPEETPDTAGEEADDTPAED